MGGFAGVAWDHLVRMDLLRDSLIGCVLTYSQPMALAPSAAGCLVCIIVFLTCSVLDPFSLVYNLCLLSAREQRRNSHSSLRCPHVATECCVIFLLGKLLCII